MHEKRAPDQRVADVAERQHGAITIAQLHDAGLSDDAVLTRTRAGRLHRLHRGVYAVGHIAPSNERRWMAAVLALGGASGIEEDGRRERRAAARAVLSHRSSAELWGLLPPSNGPVDVSLTSRSGRRRRDGIRIHRPESLEPNETTLCRGIPVTAPARSLADLRSDVSKRELRQAIRQADFLGMPTGPDIVTDGTRSELERRFLWLCARNRLPEPAVNKRLGGLTVDFCWPEQRVIVETDGYSAHRGRVAFEDDRRRDLHLRSLGFEVLRLSYSQVFESPKQTIEVLRSALSSASRAR